MNITQGNALRLSGIVLLYGLINRQVALDDVMQMQPGQSSYILPKGDTIQNIVIGSYIRKGILQIIPGILESHVQKYSLHTTVNTIPRPYFASPGLFIPLHASAPFRGDKVNVGELKSLVHANDLFMNRMAEYFSHFYEQNPTHIMRRTS